MATVTNNMTRISGIDTTDSWTNANVPTGGGGAGANTDIFLQGDQSLGRRQTTTGATPAGFALIDNADNDCSASGTHVGMWLWVTQYSIIQAFRCLLATGTTPSSNYDYWALTPSKWPALGGWVRAWVDVTTGTTGAGTYTSSTTRCYGIQVSFTGTPGGTSPNLILDSADYVTGPALTLTGTGGVWQDFATADENTSNQYGVFRSVGGVRNQWARVQLGTSGSSLVFNDSGFTIVFVEQEHVAADWMGISVDLQNASTNIDWASGVIKSAVTGIRGDLVVTGTSGTFDASGMLFQFLRLVTLTSATTILDSSFVGCGQITAAGADLSGISVSAYEGTADTSALIWNVATDPVAKLDGGKFTKGTAATHAIEFGTTSPTTMELVNMTFTGYGADASTSAALHFKRTSGTVTVTLTGTSTPTYKSDGATIVFVTAARTVKAVVTSTTGTKIQNANVFLYATSGGNLPADASVTIVNSGTTATVTHSTHGLSTNDYVWIEGASLDANNGVFQITVTGTNTYTYTMGSTPGSSPTGTILSTFVFLKGLTDINGEISMSRQIPATQPISGWARKSSSAPYYKTGPITGSVSTAADTTFPAILIADQ
jgi:hypothetical protein